MNEKIILGWGHQGSPYDMNPKLDSNLFEKFRPKKKKKNKKQVFSACTFLSMQQVPPY